MALFFSGNKASDALKLASPPSDIKQVIIALVVAVKRVFKLGVLD